MLSDKESHLVASNALTKSIRASLNAKLERLLALPLIARIAYTVARVEEDGEEDDEEDDDTPDVFLSLQEAAAEYRPDESAVHEDGAPEVNPEDGTCTVEIEIDYRDTWRGCEKKIIDTIVSTIESPVAFLTDSQRDLLERSPREFLALNPRPETADLVSFDKENFGGSERVVRLRLSGSPESWIHIQHVAIVPNLVQIERQLDALHQIELAADEGPLGPLRTLVGIGDVARLVTCPAGAGPEGALTAERCDEFQAECIRKAMCTPHFAVIQGPPGSGKTTVISGIIQRAVAKGESVLVVSPTHVAVDNVVEKLAPRHDSQEEDLLPARSLPVRYAARDTKLSERAKQYWVGRKRQNRGETIATRVRRRLCETIPFAAPLYESAGANRSWSGPLTSAVVSVESVICGTPIGILSHEMVKNAPSGSFDLLLVDEVSKMTLPEFLAIAVKARRWVLVGDPQQLPPFNDAEENATTLDDVLHPDLELVCSVGAVVERTKPAFRRELRLVVVTSSPDRLATAIRRHLEEKLPGDHPPVASLAEAQEPGIVTCSREDVEAAREFVSQVRNCDRTTNPANMGSSGLLVAHGVALAKPEFACGLTLVEPRRRAQAAIFENSFNVYHAQPWSARSGQKLPIVSFRNGADKYLPSVSALVALEPALEAGEAAIARRSALIEAIAKRFAVNTISVYDWLTGIPTECFDTSPLAELAAFVQPALCDAVRPYVGVLKKQYRMHTSLSRVPRELFYFDEALLDAKKEKQAGCRVTFRQVNPTGDECEANDAEVAAICSLLEKLDADSASRERRPEIMVITPYVKQEARLNAAIRDLSARRVIDRLDVDVCTLDRCQGREAEYVLISLVRGRATTFFDQPKRWNVALTRAKEGLVIVGNIDSYLAEAKKGRNNPRHRRSASVGQGATGNARIRMSLLARIVEAYDRQIAECQRTRADARGRAPQPKRTDSLRVVAQQKEQGAP